MKPLLYVGPLTNRVYLATRYRTDADGLVTVQTKYDVTNEVGKVLEELDRRGPATDARGEVTGLYLLHFDPPYRHARHYLGYAADIRTRVHEHASSSHHVSPLVRSALEAGAALRLTRVWLGGDRTLERRLKRQGGLSRHCPTCRAVGDYHAGGNTIAARRR